MLTRIAFAAGLLAALAARPAAAQMRDTENPLPRTWPVVLTPPLDESGAVLLREVTAVLDLLPDQPLATRRVQAADAARPAYREVALELTAAQLGRLRQWQAAHPAQAGRLGLPGQW